jgi:hypothetical protein
MNAIVRRDTVEDIVNKRNRAIELYAEAHRAIEIAAEAVSIAHEAAQSASPGINSFTHSHAEEIKAFYSAVQLPNREQYLRTARRLIDINVWSWIIERTDLERLMDKEAKDTLRKQMAYVPEKVDRTGQLINQEEIERGLGSQTPSRSWIAGSRAMTALRLEAASSSTMLSTIPAIGVTTAITGTR